MIPEGARQSLAKRFSLYKSGKLMEFLAHVPAQTRIKIAEDTMSSWIEIDIWGKYGWAQYAIWKATDELYMLDRHGAAGDDPISIRRAVAKINDIPKLRGGS